MSSTKRRRLKSLAKDVVAFYLESRDFNGLPVRQDFAYDRVEAEKLITTGELEVIAEDDFLNPHIRPWPSRRSLLEQVGSLGSALEGGSTACLYPTRQLLLMHLPLGLFKDAPYSRRMAEGSGALELAYFSLDVLEPYRNDPRYHFRYWDFGIDLGIADEAFEDETTPVRDHVSMKAGFAYSFPSGTTGPIVRRGSAFLTDLAALTPEHQRRWSSYELSPEESRDLRPHPQWWGAQMGSWPDGIGPFEKLTGELAIVNDLFHAAFAEHLFRNTTRPDDFGWVLRPSQAEWDHFVMSLDKLLSENLRSEALDRLGAPTVSPQGVRYGTLARLELGLSNSTSTPAGEIRSFSEPFRDVRAARQKPAHALRKNVTDVNLVRKQRDLLVAVVESVVALRMLLMTHPANSTYAIAEHFDKPYYRL
jgi:hypothetical protein